MSAVDGVLDATSRVVQGARARIDERRRFGGRYEFDDRRRGSDMVILVIAGYKDYLWPWVLPRIAKAAPPGVDVCIISAGRRDPRLGRFAERHGWSFLTTEANKVSLVQNIAIRLHPDARYIAKVDEDIVVGEGFFAALRSGYERVVAERQWVPGLCSPTLNVNGFSYVDFLETTGLTEAYVAEFGELTRRVGGVKATDTSEAALWLWRHSLPFDEVAARFTERPGTYAAVPHRFSIGAILFERDLFDLLGGFWVPREEPGLGADEEHISRVCMSRSRVMVVLHDLFAGHFAFGIQEQAMRAALGDLAPGLGEPEPID